MTSNEKAKILQSLTGTFGMLAQNGISQCRLSVSTQEFNMFSNHLAEFSGFIAAEFIKMAAGFASIEETYQAIFDRIEQIVAVLYNDAADTETISKITMLN
jgi:hypothetical protein